MKKSEPKKPDDPVLIKSRKSLADIPPLNLDEVISEICN